MKKLTVYTFAFFVMFSVKAQQTVDNQRSKLVVGLVIDQMRWDYLYRYSNRYSNDGFKRILSNGHSCQNTMINYLPTFTGPGHASIYTGTVPAIHGIAANDWMDMAKQEFVYCAEDENVSTVGGSVKAGKMSPANMYTTTITDELKIATKGRAKVFGVGLKDRGSILPAGHAANGAFWFDDSTGNFITSSHYMSQLPEWLNNFNQKRWADTIQNSTWTTIYPLETYTNSTADETAFEGKLKGESNTSFPHQTPEVKGRGYNGIRYMPAANTFTLKAAVACINGEQLGDDDITDFLCITLSSADYAGHMYGPDAAEMEDMYLRLDRDIAELLQYLDKKVGTGQYTLFITADHGAAHNAGYMQSLKIPAGSNTQMSYTKSINEHLKSKFEQDSLVLALYNYQVYLNEALIKRTETDREDVKSVVASWLYDLNEVAFVVDMEDIDDAVIPDVLQEMIVNGYDKRRSGCMQIILKPGWYSGYGNTGTTHGSWNAYDTHIPLLWYGWGVKKGQTYKNVSITDIAPTIAAMLHIQMPNGCTGEVIEEVLAK